MTSRHRAITIFHYHLLPGGVTTVIRDGLLALRAYHDLIPDLRRVTVVAAGPIDDRFRAAVGAAGGDGAGPEIEVVEEPAVGYDDAAPSAADRQRLAEHLRQRFGGSLWWVHNHHLAKNTSFTGAVLERAAGGQPMVLQVHDFPECSRPANLHRLLAEVPGSPYPTGANVHYAVLSTRDHQALLAAGIAASQVTLLPNPVRPVAALPAPASVQAHAARARLAAAGIGSGSLAGSEVADVHPPLLLYPVRVRRRKNVLEAGLLARMLEAELVVTLPASSTVEQAYSQTAERLFADGVIPGLYGVGDHLDAAGITFDQLLAASDVVVSSSVEEGFGYGFINAVQWRRPLLARRLPVVDDIESLFEGYPSHFYQAVVVPVSSAERRKLQDAYARTVSEVGAGLPAESKDRLNEELAAALAEPAVDMALLDVEQQAAVLRRARHRDYADELAAANRVLLTSAEALIGAPAADRSAAVDAALGERRFATDVAAMLQRAAARAAAGDGDGDGHDDADPQAVRRYFAQPGAVRLLAQT